MMRFLRITKRFIAAAALGAACTFAAPVAASADRYERHVWLPFPPPPPFPFFFRPRVVHRDYYYDHRDERWERRHDHWYDRRDERHERRHDRHDRWHR